MPPSPTTWTSFSFPILVNVEKISAVGGEGESAKEMIGVDGTRSGRSRRVSVCRMLQRDRGRTTPRKEVNKRKQRRPCTTLAHVTTISQKCARGQSPVQSTHNHEVFPVCRSSQTPTSEPFSSPSIHTDGQILVSSSVVTRHIGRQLAAGEADLGAPVALVLGSLPGYNQQWHTQHASGCVAYDTGCAPKAGHPAVHKLRSLASIVLHCGLHVAPRLQTKQPNGRGWRPAGNKLCRYVRGSHLGSQSVVSALSGQNKAFADASAARQKRMVAKTKKKKKTMG
ncbi:hypothetical protein IWZ03DRAFT_190578 [Phyllosticta citriasiana]|uniref:Uncharacterized protein n=1 Tax=Phyllosticta citriasiana TaxID=595635 RepID=A0ABR1KM20_9PEZI